MGIFGIFKTKMTLPAKIWLFITYPWYIYGPTIGEQKSWGTPWLEALDWWGIHKFVYDEEPPRWRDDPTWTPKERKRLMRRGDGQRLKLTDTIVKLMLLSASIMGLGLAVVFLETKDILAAGMSFILFLFYLYIIIIMLKEGTNP